MNSGLRLGSGRGSLESFSPRSSQKEGREMTRIIVHTAISAALALAGFYSSPSLAADGDNSGKLRRRPGRPGHPRLFQRPLLPFIPTTTTKAHTTTAPMRGLRGRRGIATRAASKPIRPRPRRAISGASAFARGLCLAACTVLAARSVERDGEGRDYIDHRHQGEEEERRSRCAIPD